MTIWCGSVLTISPDMFPGPLGLRLAGRSLQEGKWRLDVIDIRDFSTDRHRSVDDKPVGGGPGMVMRVDVLACAFDHALRSEDDQRPCIYLSPRGAPLKQKRVRELSLGPGIVVLAGRFEGIDERLMTARGIEEVSIGDFILSGGDIAAMALIDACVRLLPGVMGKCVSGNEESFENNLLEYPQYAKPKVFEGLEIPPILLSGNHQSVAHWRQQQAERITRERRPDLWADYLVANTKIERD